MVPIEIVPTMITVENIYTRFCFYILTVCCAGSDGWLVMSDNKAQPGGLAKCIANFYVCVPLFHSPQIFQGQF